MESDMHTMQVEQAVFASSDRGRMKGYQLVSKSPGVDREVSQELCRWAPTQMMSNDPDEWTINYFPVTPEFVAVTRTVLGGPEYSRRGASQVVTLILLLRDTQFEFYDYNPVAVSKTAMAMGYLRLPLNMEQEQIPQATLPIRPIIEPHASIQHETSEGDSYSVLDEVRELLVDSRRVAVVGCPKPYEAVHRLIQSIPLNCRKEISFTTGLSPSVRRPFQAQFLTSADNSLQKTLESQSIAVLDAR